MVPFVDLANHNSSAPSKIVNRPDRNVVTVRTQRSYKRGEEVRISYTRSGWTQCNSRML